MRPASVWDALHPSNDGLGAWRLAGHTVLRPAPPVDEEFEEPAEEQEVAEPLGLDLGTLREGLQARHRARDAQLRQKVWDRERGVKQWGVKCRPSGAGCAAGQMCAVSEQG